MKRLHVHGDVVARFAPQDMNVLIVMAITAYGFGLEWWRVHAA
jgi:hypothetical protein